MSKMGACAEVTDAKADDMIKAHDDHLDNLREIAAIVDCWNVANYAAQFRVFM